jgi:hypothetical protein
VKARWYGSMRRVASSFSRRWKRPPVYRRRID